MLPICQLFYISRASKEFDSALIQDILQVARRNNHQLDVTGCLLYSGTFFAQVLEGSNEVVQELALRIARDPRHHEVQFLLENHRVEREYGDWSMGYLHDQGLADVLESLMRGDGDPNTIADVIGRMKPDTMMGAL